MCFKIYADITTVTIINSSIKKIKKNIELVMNPKVLVGGHVASAKFALRVFYRLSTNNFTT